MTDMLKTGASKYTRRAIVQAAAVAGAVPALVLAASPALAKASQASVAYQDTPKDGKNCANCNVFVSPDSCKIVDGKVSPNGWCKVWVKKVG